MSKSNKYEFWNEDASEGAKKYIPDNSIDLIITDPPYGIKGDTLHKHYNRKEKYVIPDYIEIPENEYGEFSSKWIEQAERILRPGGSIYIVSGYSNLYHILAALRETSLEEKNHIIWKYNFGVYTRRKYISSHYHILFCTKPGGKITFNTFTRFGFDERDKKGGSLNYRDREDVWIINRDYKPEQKKNKNELPLELLSKIILYSSNEGDLIADLFLGGFNTAKAAIGLNRKITGFEKSLKAYKHGISVIEKLEPGYLLESLKKPKQTLTVNRYKRWEEGEKNALKEKSEKLAQEGYSKRELTNLLASDFGRGKFSISRMLKKLDAEE